MYTVMVTGGIGSGKSALVELICAQGAVSIDLDEINRSLLASNEAMLAELVEAFGEGILDENGIIVASELAARAFVDEASTRQLNAISFPYITEAAMDYILGTECVPRSDAKILVVEVPLLSEVPEFAELADEIIAVVAPSDLRLSRAVKRGMDAQDVLQRMHRQATDEQRIALADTVCENMGTYEDLEQWVERWWNERVATLEE